MDMGAIVKAGQAADLTDLFDAPSLDIPGKKVKRHAGARARSSRARTTASRTR